MSEPDSGRDGQTKGLGLIERFAEVFDPHVRIESPRGLLEQFHRTVTAAAVNDVGFAAPLKRPGVAVLDNLDRHRSCRDRGVGQKKCDPHTQEAPHADLRARTFGTGRRRPAEKMRNFGRKGGGST